MKYATEEAFVGANAFGKGAANTAYAQYFVGNSYLNPLTDPQVTALHLSNVTFEPGCHNKLRKPPNNNPKNKNTPAQQHAVRGCSVSEYSYRMVAWLPPVGALVTRICRSMAARRSATWEMIPTNRSLRARSVRACSAWWRDSSSREPKPSSTNIASSRTPPAALCTRSDSPSSSDKEA